MIDQKDIDAAFAECSLSDDDMDSVTNFLEQQGIQINAEGADDDDSADLLEDDDNDDATARLSRASAKRRNRSRTAFPTGATLSISRIRSACI